MIMNVASIQPFLCKGIFQRDRVPIGPPPARSPNGSLLRGGHLEAGGVGAAEEVPEALLEQGQVDDPDGGGAAAADGGGDYHLVAGLDRADAVPLGVDECGTGHLVAVAVAVGAAQRDRRA